MRNIALSGAIAIGVLGAMAGQAMAQEICYESDTGQVMRLSAKTLGGLTTSSERAQYGHAEQTVLSLHGKIVSQPQKLSAALIGTPPDLGAFTTAALLGTAIVGNGQGIHLLLADTAGSGIECFDDESAGVPQSLTCNNVGSADRDALLATRTLTFALVDPLDQPLCGAFALPEIDDEPDDLPVPE
jgi:hypothetical protein